MKVLDTPRSGKCGQEVFWRSRYGLCARQHVPQQAALTPARQQVCALFGNNSRKWSARLSDEQADRWNLAGSEVMSHPRLAERGPLTGHQLWSGISTVRAVVGLPETLEVPPRPAFGPSNAGRLIIENDENGVRLYLAVSGELNEDIMVFGQEPCSRGRYKRRNVSYIGLLPPPIGGLSEITRLYRAKFGEPRAGTKVFIVTCQEKDGWKGLDQETSATVPERPKAFQAITEAGTSHTPLMHTGSTGAAQGQEARTPSQSLRGAETETEGGKAATPASEPRGAPNDERAAPV